MQRLLLSFVLLLLYSRCGMTAAEVAPTCGWACGGNQTAPGSLNSSLVEELARGVGGAYLQSLLWLSQQRMFAFPAHDNLTLQGYELLPELLPDSTPSSNDVVLIYCAGWTETTLKYAGFLQDLVSKRGLAVYSFDFRGQGFSANTGYDLGRFTHVHAFDEYVQDLALFARMVADRHPQQRLVYVGNSLSGLVGLATELRHPGIFARLVVAAPVIKPSATLNPLIRYALKWAHGLGFGARLLARLDSDIAGLKLTHNLDIFAGWRKMREVRPAELVVQGPSLAWMTELTEQGHAVLAHAGDMRVPLLIFVASFDLFVDNPSIYEFANAYGAAVKVVKFNDSWHELYTEEPRVYDALMSELDAFLRE